jgi:hypothetical protein
MHANGERAAILMNVVATVRLGGRGPSLSRSRRAATLIYEATRTTTHRLYCPGAMACYVRVCGGAVVGIPRWHARGQGFKSPQLHQAQRHSSTPAQGHLPEICQSLTSCVRLNTLRADRFGGLEAPARWRELS